MGKKKKRNAVATPKKTVKKKSNMLLTVVIGVIFVALVSLTLVKLNDAHAAKVAEKGQMAPDFTLTSPSGKQVTLSQFRGKPVVLNFWATWCPPCKLEMPTIEKLSQEAAAKGFVLLTVNQEEDGGTVQNFLQQNKYDFPVVLDTSGQVSQTYQVSGIPTSVFIDAKGIIRDIHTGTMPEEQLFLSKIPFQ